MRDYFFVVVIIVIAAAAVPMVTYCRGFIFLLLLLLVRYLIDGRVFMMGRVCWYVVGRVPWAECPVRRDKRVRVRRKGGARVVGCGLWAVIAMIDCDYDL